MGLLRLCGVVLWWRGGAAWGARAYAHGLPRHFAEATATILVNVAERMQSLWTALHTTSALFCARGEEEM